MPSVDSDRDDPELGPHRRRHAAVVVVLSALVIASTGHRFANALVFDDQAVIGEGSVIHDPRQLGAVWTHHTMFASASDPGDVQSIDTYRPLTITTFFVDAQISGRDPWAYHLTNLLLHLGCVLLVLAVGLLLMGRGALLPVAYGTAVFAVHPWAVEAHVWINGRSDPLSLLLGLAGFAVLLRQERRPWRALPHLGATALLIAGLLSKETLLLAFLAILVAPEPAGTETPIRERLRRRGPPLALAAFTYIAARAVVLSGLATHRDGAMLTEAARRLPWLCLDALRQALAPSMPYLRSLRDEYASLAGWQVALAVVALLALAVGAWRLRRERPVLAWTPLWFFPPLTPIAILSTVLWPGFGRYLYLPLAGLAWALAAIGISLAQRISRRTVIRTAAIAHVMVLALLAAAFTRDFESSESLYGAAIEARPDVAMGWGWLGLARQDRGEHASAASALLRAAELDPSTHRYLIHGGRELLAAGRRREAAAVAADGVRRFRGQPEEAPYHLLALNAMTHADPERAVARLVRCLEVWPGREDCAIALRFLVERTDDAEANRVALQRYIDAHPSRRDELSPYLERTP